jgi:hypothetical protein
MQAFLVGAAASILLFVRIPQAPRNFWTDDGELFQDAHDRGVLTPFAYFYKGYLQTLQRALAAVSAAVPIRSAPAVLFILTAIVIGWCAATTFLVARPWIVSGAGRLAMAVSLVALPSFGKANIGSADFLQFTMLFVALLVLLHDDDSKGVTANSCAFLVISGLSSLLVVTLLPALVWRAVRRRGIRGDAVAISYVGATAVQVLWVAIFRPARPPLHVSKSLRSVASGYLHNVIGDNIAPSSGLRIVLVLGGIVVIFLVVSAVVLALLDGAL